MKECIETKRRAVDVQSAMNQTVVDTLTQQLEQTQVADSSYI